MKNIIIALFLVVGSIAYGANDIDKNVIILNQTRSDKVKSVFKELMKYYEDEDEDKFFSLVSEDRFLQDYMLFQQAIEKDFRTYEILDFDYWIDKITSDGVRRYLYVKWEKRYQYINGTDELTKRGYSRFLFDEINGQYKLIELAGNVLWGDSLSEWKNEIPHIAGEEKRNALPDLTVIDLACQGNPTGNGSLITFKIKNIGDGATKNGQIEWKGYHGSSSQTTGTYSDILAPQETTPTITWTDYNLDCSTQYGIVIWVDPNNLIQESDESNNLGTLNTTLMISQ